MKRRILQIIPTLDRYGAEKQLALLSNGLPADQFDVHVCALTRGGPRAEELTRSGVPVTVIGKRWKMDAFAFWQLQRYIRRLQPDLVQTWLFAANSYGRVAALAAGVRHIIAGERGVNPWKRSHQLYIDRVLARRTDAIVVNSPGVRDFYVERGLPLAKFRVIPGGVTPARPSDVSREQLLSDLGLPLNSRLIGGVGRLSAEKRWKDVIWASDLLKVFRQDAHLVIIGDGPQSARIVRYRNLIRIADKVHFLGERPDVWRLIPHFDLLWLASGYEGLSNAVMEAMAAGVPVVVSDIPGNRDLVVHGQTGYLVAVGDRAGYARHANRLLNDASLQKRIGEAGRAHVLEHFSVSKMIHAHVQLYRELLN